jgi:hypothetical protein
MPKKGAKKTKDNKQLSTTLPDGARHLLDQLVALKVVGDGHSGVIAFLVQSQLQIMARDYGLKLPGAANTPSTGAKPDDEPQR